MSNLAFQLTLNGIVAGALYSLVALGFSFQYRVAKFFDFGYAAVFAIGGYGCWAVLKLGGFYPSSIATWRFIISALAGVFAASAVALILERLIYRQLRTRGANPLVLLLSSLGIFAVLQNTISLFAGDDVKIIRPGLIAAGLPLTLPIVGTAYITPVQLGTVITSITLAIILGMVLMYSEFGKRFRAVANDSELAEIVGINSDNVHAVGHMIAGGLAAVAAIWMALDTDLVPRVGFRILVIATAAMVVGGLGSIRGAVVGAMCIGLVENLAAIRIGTQWQDTIVFLLLIVFLLFRPQGIIGRRSLATKLAG